MHDKLTMLAVHALIDVKVINKLICSLQRLSFSGREKKSHDTLNSRWFSTMDLQ